MNCTMFAAIAFGILCVEGLYRVIRKKVGYKCPICRTVKMKLVSVFRVHGRGDKDLYHCPQCKSAWWKPRYAVLEKCEAGLWAAISDNYGIR